MIDKLLVTVFSWVLALFLSVQLFLTSLPLFRRLEYEAICHKYCLLMDHDGGLTPMIEGGLQRELEDRGFFVDHINGTLNAPFGGEISLYVAARDRSSRITRSLNLEEVDISYTYQSSIICRRLKT